MNEQIQGKETQSNNSKTLSNKARRKRKKKFYSNQKGGRKDIRRRNSKVALTMSTWAESFTVAATWQLKHQIAYWKARAKALEYENQVLHDIIRKNNCVTDTAQSSKTYSKREVSVDNSDAEVEPTITENDQEEMDFEVSEEFIEFLIENAKYKEDARRERERLRAKIEEEESNSVYEEPQESSEDKQEKLQELYGNHWQRIAALEIAMQSKFINDNDKDKPMYWPNIPFNFNFSQN
ncbi:unnamed protein product [Parnassius apollo]|uniref:(apollo) hypothetical protein n=1 Tax=Parnassius apollo TaxID=110799 RepID=A0A8S3X356_PARAO|nr:unnamed protein product [Parnassius apollo]